MESSKTKSFSDAIVVWPEDLIYFNEFLGKHFAKVEYEGKCEDDTKLRPSNLSELLDYENPDFKRLSSITISASDGEILGDRTEIVIGKAGMFSIHTGMANFRFRDVKQQIPIEDEVLKRIRTMRPWYFWLHKASFAWVLLVLPIGLGLVLNTISLIQKLSSPVPLTSSSPSRFTEGEALVLAWGVLGILFLVGYLIDRSKDYLFPKYFFCIGRQKKEYERRKNSSYLIFAVIILGILINIASTIILQPFSP